MRRLGRLGLVIGSVLCGPALVAETQAQEAVLDQLEGDWVCGQLAETGGAATFLNPSDLNLSLETGRRIRIDYTGFPFANTAGDPQPVRISTRFTYERDMGVYIDVDADDPLAGDPARWFRLHDGGLDLFTLTVADDGTFALETWLFSLVEGGVESVYLRRTGFNTPLRAMCLLERS